MSKSLFDTRYDLYGREERSRKPVRKNLKKFVLEKVQKGKCAKCRKSLKVMKVRGHTHHKNMNPKDNRVENLIIVCPNCHDRIHQKEKKVRVKTRDALGIPTYKVVKKRKRKSKKKRKKKRHKQRPINPLDIEIKPIKLDW